MLKTKFIKNTGLLFSGSLIAQFIGFFAVPLLSRMYHPEDFGALGLFTSIVATVSVFSGLRYEMAIVVEDDESKAKGLTQLAIFWNLIIGLALLLIIALFKVQIASVFGIQHSNWLYLVGPVISLSGVLESLVFWRNRQRKFAKISTNRILSSGGSSALKLAYPFSKLAGNGLILGHSLGQLIAVIHLAYKSGISFFDYNINELKALMKEYKQFPLFSAPAALVNTLAVRMPFFLLAFYGSLAETGYLDNASRLTYLPMSMLAMASSQVFFERIARLKRDKVSSALMSHQLINFLFLLGILPVGLLFVFGHDIIPWILGPEWSEAGVYVEILILFYFSIFLTAPFSSAFETYNKLKEQLIYNIAFLVLTTAAMIGAYLYFDSTRIALLSYAGIALAMRLLILNYFFHLFGRKLLGKTLIGILLLAAVIWLLNLLKVSIF